ncbi:TetR/AcrR family transcriptional regulator [Pseudomaricurvus alkylphenolicus]|uniref:TetR/AcrR family transcriptional regulator n=1 Tax=Pseudomaricurvus alkylphenolicus TaxID=1306991 RepID=UPI00141F5A3F|nr:TetR/AcrR family transcriptional regulator [Pseudomaricurvus alkylphenolicus]NIB41109.1 TetR/AcrR family transcriptional regulator [Pseudomaricurvus alkylphenolicus]
MARIKTKDLILEVALLLFNERGERLVTSVDLANEMNISPGNLYYHFKGKEEIVEELYARFHTSLVLVIDNMSSVEQITAKSLLSYLSLVADIFTQYRFITQDLRGLGAHYPNVEPQVTKAFSRLHRQIQALVEQLPSREATASIENSARLLTDNLINTLLHADVREVFAPSEPSEAVESPIDMHDRLLLQLLPFLPPQDASDNAA